MVKTCGGRFQSAKKGSSSQETQPPSKRAKMSSTSLEPPYPHKPKAPILSTPKDYAGSSEKLALVVKSRHSSPKTTSQKSKLTEPVVTDSGKQGEAQPISTLGKKKRAS